MTRHGPPSDARPGPSAGRYRLAIAAGLLVACSVGWVVLVGLRPGPPTVTAGDAIGRDIEAAVARSLLADRMLAVTRWVGNVAGTLVLGGLIYRYLVLGVPSAETGRRQQVAAAQRKASLVTAAAVTGVAAELTGLALRAVAASADGIAAAVDPSALGAILDTRFGDAALSRITGLSLIAGAWRGGTPAPDGHDPAAGRRGSGAPTARLLDTMVLSAGGLAVLGSYGMSGHAQAADPARLLVPVQLLHVLVVSTWFGGMVMLGIELKGWEARAEELAELVARFSTVAGATIVAAAATGAALAVSQLSSPTDLTATGYGRALLVKLTILAVPLALGAYNRQRLVPAVRQLDETGAWRHLRLSLAAEALVVALGVLLATAAMTSGGF